MLEGLKCTGIFFEAPESSLRISTNMTKNRTKKEVFPPKIYHLEVELPTSILRRRIFTIEILGFIENHKSYAFLDFFTST